MGFDDTDLSHIWDDSLETDDDQFDVDEELKAIAEPKTKRGELYQLGAHRLLCGDATDPTTVQRLVGGEKMTMIYTGMCVYLHEQLMAGEEGFEPPNDGSRDRCLTTWRLPNGEKVGRLPAGARRGERRWDSPMLKRTAPQARESPEILP